MLQKFLLSGFVLFLFFQASAQNNTVSGRLRDAENGSSVQGATVVIRSIRDSVQQQTTYTDTSGRFQFDDLARDSFRLTISSVGFETMVRHVKVDTATVDMGDIGVPRLSQELSGVVVRSSIPPATQKGDTVQFNASQFKVNPDASAEDLARKMPGITVENGQVKANGENVQKVTIDGRELFGDDATAALRNLPAEIIDKIQVFDRLSDQAQLSGFDDGNTQKGINIVTKANMRNGQFGRVYAGYGTDNRYQAGGNATFLKENRRISLVGNFNNTNQQNFSQQDLLGVTSSNNQRGGPGGGGPRGGGGGGNRGGNPGGGGMGGFGSNANFLVGQQPGINKTNAVGINFSDLWGGKRNLTATGSYFFNNTNNTTDQVSTTQYFADNVPDLSQRTQSNSRNNNHRINMRLEYRIDSSNQLIISPNISFQDNETDRLVNSSRYWGTINDLVRETSNTSSSSRNGYNANNNILFRHSFRKRGRTFSINLNTSFNRRESESYVTSLQREMNGAGMDDTTTQRFTNQMNNGRQVSTNLSYAEPVGKNAQLQLNYNPSFSKSASDQETFGLNPVDSKYSLYYDSLSNIFENTTRAHNAGLSYRYGNRDRQISFGVNYQQTTLSSAQTSPRVLTVSKTFSNFLPNARIQYKISPRSSLRVMYRGNTNLPSVTQLQNVIDPNDEPFFTMGNPDLEQQYTHFLSTQYTFTNTARGILLVGNVFAQKADNYISNATYVPTRDSVIYNGFLLERGQQLSIPVNMDGYVNLRSFVTFAIPLKFIKSTFNLNGGVSYARLPGILNNIASLSRNHTYTAGSVLASNVSQYVDFTVSYAANFSKVRSPLLERGEDEYFSHAAGLQLNLLNKKGWFFQNDVTNQLYRGLSEGLNQNYFLWNMSAGKKILKDQKGELRLSVFDLLKQNQSITREVNENYIRDIQNQVLTQYFMLTFSYNLRNFGTAAGRAMNRNRPRN